MLEAATIYLFIASFGLGVAAFGGLGADGGIWLDILFVIAAVGFLSCFVAQLGRKLSRIIIE